MPNERCYRGDKLERTDVYIPLFLDLGRALLLLAISVF